jgi:hypothetical protein
LHSLFVHRKTCLTDIFGGLKPQAALPTLPVTLRAQTTAEQGKFRREIFRLEVAKIE